MKSTIIFFILAISYCSFGQSIEEIDFDLAIPIDEIRDDVWDNRNGVFIKFEEGRYVWLYSVTTIGYGRSEKKLKKLLEANDCVRPADEDESIIPDHVDDEFSDYSDMAHYCRLEEAEIVKRWVVNDEWTIGWIVNHRSSGVWVITGQKE